MLEVLREMSSSKLLGLKYWYRNSGTYDACTSTVANIYSTRYTSVNIVNRFVLLPTAADGMRLINHIHALPMDLFK